MYVRRKTIKGKTYFYLVKSVRENGKVRQVYLEYLGAAVPSQKKVRELASKYEKKR